MIAPRGRTISHGGEEGGANQHRVASLRRRTQLVCQPEQPKEAPLHELSTLRRPTGAGGLTHPAQPAPPASRSAAGTLIRGRRRVDAACGAALAPQHGLRRAGARTESRDVTLRELRHLHVAIEEARIEVLRGRNHSSPPRGVVVMPSDSIERLHKGTGPRQIISPATAAAGSSVWLHNDLMAPTAGG
jgi:hypothetical protein